MWSPGFTLPKSSLFKCKAASASGTKLTLAFRAWMLLTPALVIAIPEIERNCRLEKHYLLLGRFAPHRLACVSARDSSCCHNTANKLSCCHRGLCSIFPNGPSSSQEKESKSWEPGITFQSWGWGTFDITRSNLCISPSKCYHYLCFSGAVNEIWRGKLALPQIAQVCRCNQGRPQPASLLTQRCRVWCRIPWSEETAAQMMRGAHLAQISHLSLQPLGCRFQGPFFSPWGWV